MMDLAATDDASDSLMQMQTDRASQAGSLDTMELEDPHSHVSDRDPAALTGASATALARDMEIEYGEALDHDQVGVGHEDDAIERDGRGEDPNETFLVTGGKHDDEMLDEDYRAVDLEEDEGYGTEQQQPQEHPTSANGAAPKVSEAVEISLADPSGLAPASQTPETQQDSNKANSEANLESSGSAGVDLVNQGEASAVQPHTESVEDSPDKQEALAVQQSPSATSGPLSYPGDSEAHATGAGDSTILAGQSQGETAHALEDGPEDDLADADPKHQFDTASLAHTQQQAGPTSLAHTDPWTRPALQKDYLAHIDVFTGYAPEQAQDEPDKRSAPHVSLLFNDQEYSLFRPSSSPSGDDEDVLFGEDQEHREGDFDPDQELYYASLEQLFQALRRTFSELQHDGELELILDFGILDMQVHEDNVYSRQLSLHDFDRIRVGMCQPELDRLQVTLKTGKRFAARFNELAEHCYRMHAGSDDDDTGTIYEEILDPLTADDDDDVEQQEAPGENPTDSHLQAEALSASDTHESGLAASEAQPAADFVSGLNIEDLADPDEAANERDDAEAEVALADGLDPANQPPTTLLSDRQNTHEAVDAAEDEQGDVHPPSDEHYQDPEFANGVESYEEEDEEEEVAEGRTTEADTNSTAPREEDNRGLQEGEDLKITPTQTPQNVEHTLDPTAPLEDVAQELEEYEEEEFEAATAGQAETEAALGGFEDGDLGSSRKVDVHGNEDAQGYYHEMASPYNEEVVLVEQPAPHPDAPVDIVKADALGHGQIEEQTEADTRVLATKRSHDELETPAVNADTTASDSGISTETKRAKIAV